VLRMAWSWMRCGTEAATIQEIRALHGALRSTERPAAFDQRRVVAWRIENSGQAKATAAAPKAAATASRLAQSTQ